MPGKIVVINPNCDTGITERTDASLAPLRFDDGPEIVCRTLAQGPIAIESEYDGASVVLPLCELIRREDNEAGAFVIACFSDPGLGAARETTSRPVFGVAEAGLTTALNLGQRFGLIHNFNADIAPARRYARTVGVESRLAGERALNVGVTELADEDSVRGPMLDAARELKEQDGADVLVFGCAGMTSYRAALEEALHIPVVDPTLAATGLALTAVCFGYRHANGASRT